MNTSSLLTQLTHQLHDLSEKGLYKSERELDSAQGGHVELQNTQQLINFCSNNYLGLANNPRIIQAAHQALDRYGYGMASVRFICGTQTIHKRLEQRISQFLGTEDTILYSSCFDANGGLFETLLSEQDAIISDSLNHASIIDGIRLCKAQRYRYNNNDMDDLERALKEARNKKVQHILIVTDGVFSMDGIIANVPNICDLAEQYQALVMVDDSHGVGVLGQTGKGTHEYHNAMQRVDIITGTLGKALGGASGGYTSAAKPIIDWLRQRSRPYLFSNSLAPAIAATSLTALDLIEHDNNARDSLRCNTTYFQNQLLEAGFRLIQSDHPIIPVMLGSAETAQRMAAALQEEGILVTGFSYPVVPLDKARIRTQMSAAHSRAELDTAIAAFKKVGQKLHVI